MEEIERLELMMELEETKRHVRHVEMKVDDLEGVIARVLKAFAHAQTPGERCAALEVAESLPTMRTHLADDADEDRPSDGEE